MDPISDLNGVIDRCTKYAIRALKRNDEVSAFNSLKALVHMHFQMQNYHKASELIRVAKEVFKDF